MSEPAAAAPAIELELEWLGDFRVRARSGDVELTMDSPPRAGPNPVQALAMALAGCMAMDVIEVVRKGRYPLTRLTARLAAERAASHPRRIVSVDLRFRLEGAVPEDRVARAIELSREKYCSVWHSLRTDIALTTSFEVIAGP